MVYITKLKRKLLLIVVIIIMIFDIFIYYLDKVIRPSVLSYAEMEMKTRATLILNQKILDEYSKEFNYDNIINIEKDNEGNITMLKADTLKMNRIACDVALESQKELRNVSTMKVDIPLAYIFKNNLIALHGPKIPVYMEPVGYIETKYVSQFESAGINQTSHKIYVIVKTNVRVVIPSESNEVQVQCEIPIAETIIVGKIPNTAIGLDLGDGGIKLKN